MMRFLKVTCLIVSGASSGSYGSAREPCLARRCTAHAAQLAVHRDQVDQGAAGAQLDQADVVKPALQTAADDIAVEFDHAIGLDGSDYNMVETEDLKHDRTPSAMDEHLLDGAFDPPMASPAR